jgi:hypothetical protein
MMPTLVFIVLPLLDETIENFIGKNYGHQNQGAARYLEATAGGFVRTVSQRWGAASISSRE